MGHRSTPSATSRVFVILIGGVVIVSVAVTALLVWDSRRAEYRETERTTQALALALSDAPTTAAALASPIGSEPVAELQNRMSRLSREADVSYITVMDARGTRFTHPDRAEIGATYRGTIPDAPRMLTERWTGTLGPSVRSIAPVSAPSGETIGWVSVGITVDTIGTNVLRDLPVVFAVTLVFALVGLAAALAGRRITRRITGDLSADAVRDALVSHDSLRTLSESLRAQTHEHGNRLHAAVALLELGRTEEAIEMLAETSRRSQAMVDRVTAPASIEPAVSALIVGKTAQAAERGVGLEADLAPDAPHTALAAIELVSIIGNLLDNAIDAAASGTVRPRAVRLSISGATTTGARGLRIRVADSGDGIDGEVRERLFEWGVSTKPTPEGREADGRGVGLALVARIVREAGGVLTVNDAPTTFEVRLPSAARSAEEHA